MSLDEFLADPSTCILFSENSRPRLSDGLHGGFRERHSNRLPSDGAPLPTSPPYTAFVGNLPYEVTESEVAVFFSGHETKSIKIIKDRDGRPKGFGYIEFATLDGLKDALARSGQRLVRRTIRVNVARPPKPRSTKGGKK